MTVYHIEKQYFEGYNEFEYHIIPYDLFDKFKAFNTMKEFISFMLDDTYFTKKKAEKFCIFRNKVHEMLISEQKRVLNEVWDESITKAVDWLKENINSYLYVENPYGCPIPKANNILFTDLQEVLKGERK